MINPSEIKAAFDLLRDLYNYVNQAANHDPKVIESLEAIRVKVLDAREKEIELMDKIRELQEKLDMKQLPWDSDLGAYYKDVEGGKREYFCQKCADADSRLCRLHDLHDGYYCRVCNQSYSTSAQRAASHAAIDEYNASLDRGGWR